MERKVWKVGDWGFFEFKLAVVSDSYGKKDEVNGISTGFIFCGCDPNDLRFGERMLPLTLKNLVISKEYECVYDKLHELGLPGNIYPDLYRKVEGLWIEDCIKASKLPEGKWPKDLYKELHSLHTKYTEGMKKLKDI